MSFNSCIITSVLPRDIKGIQILIDNFIQILEPISETIYLITGNYRKDLSKSQINLINLEFENKNQNLIIRMFNFIFTQFKMGYELFKIRNKVDTVFFFISIPYVIPLLIAKIANKRAIIIVTGSSSEDAKQVYKKSNFWEITGIFPKIIGFLERISYYFADDLILVSEKLVNEVGLEKYKEKINYACATFVDVSKFSILTKLNDRENLIGFIGRLTETKGIMQFVKAIAILSKEENLKFFIGGDGSLREEVEKEISKNNLNYSVILEGWIPHEDLPDYLNQLKLLVIPSYSEAFPAIGLEAMACGTPILITPVGGVIDIIEDEKTGFLMDDNSPEVMAKNIQRALNYADLERVATNSRALLENNYSYKIITERYESILRA